MLKMNLLRLTANDVVAYKDNIIRMLKQSYNKSFHDMAIKDKYFTNKINSAVDYLNNNQAIIYVAEQANELLGLIWFYEKKNTVDNVIHIVHFVVLEEHRNKGIGTKLLNKLEEYAAGINIQQIELLVTKDNVDSVKYYENRDFTINRYLMSKKI